MSILRWDGTLIEAWASLKSVRAKMARMTRLKEVGVIRSGISTGKSARTIRMSRALTLRPGCIAKVLEKEARLYYMGHVLMENRHGLVVDGDLTEDSGTAERDTAVDMGGRTPGQTPDTVGGDKLYDTKALLRNFATQGDPACGTE